MNPIPYVPNAHRTQLGHLQSRADWNPTGYAEMLARKALDRKRALGMAEAARRSQPVLTGYVPPPKAEPAVEDWRSKPVGYWPLEARRTYVIETVLAPQWRAMHLRLQGVSA